MGEPQDHDDDPTAADSSVGLSSEFAAPPPDSFTGYKILKEVHRGGQGVVYKAVQESTKRTVAIKVMRDGPFAGSSDKARFDREVQVLGQLNHPNIVAVHDTGVAAGCHYFVMDYVAGQTLDAYMAGERQQRSVKETLQLFGQICEAVNAAHLCGVIHRDLKPANIRIDTDGQPHVLDFGLAKVATRDDLTAMTMTGQFVGSLPWASPEQAEAVPSKIDVRTDVYSLGVVLYQMLTGRFPYDVSGSKRDVLDRIMTAEPARPRSIRRQIDDEVETIVLKCLSKERERRYQSAGELGRDIERYLAGKPIEAKRDSLWYLLHKRVVRRKWQLGALVGLAVMLAATYGFWSRSRQMELSAQRAAESLEQQRIAARIRSDWYRNDSEIRVLYDNFFKRLQSGETTAEERELYFSHVLEMELKTRRLWGLDFPWHTIILVRHKTDFEAHGLAIGLSVKYELGSQTIDQAEYWFRSSLGTQLLSQMLDRGKMGVKPDVPAELELRATINLAVCREEAVEEELRSAVSSWNPLNPIWTGQKVLRQPITLLRKLPDHYPLAISDPEAAEEIETGFQAKKLWVGDERLGFVFGHAGPLYIAGWLEVLDSRGGPVIGRMSFEAATGNLGGGKYGSPESAWPAKFLEAVRGKDLTSVAVRIVPDRRVALSVPDLEVYYGLVIERTVPVAEGAEWRQ